MISGRIRNLACSIGALLIIGALPVSAGAAEAEPAVGSYAWYWETQKSQAVTDPTSGADVATIEAPNPFCPSTSAGGTPEQAGACHPGRLPVEVQGGDYETPDKLSAVAFDLALVPIDSTVSKFEVTFLEATDNQSQPQNAEGKQLQACYIEEFFGDGDARQYKEVPRYECTKSDPVAKRKAVKIKTKDGKVDRFQYTFDLTAFAKKWVEGAPVAGIMLSPVEPKEASPTTDTNWRVVLDGPAEENGIVASITYKAPPGSRSWTSSMTWTPPADSAALARPTRSIPDRRTPSTPAPTPRPPTPRPPTPRPPIRPPRIRWRPTSADGTESHVFHRRAACRATSGSRCWPG